MKTNNTATERLACEIKRKGISITAICNNTGLDYKTTWAKLTGNTANGLSLDAGLLICKFTGIDPLSLRD